MSYNIIICINNPTYINQINTIIQNFNLFHNNIFKIKLKTSYPEEVENYLKASSLQKNIYFLGINANDSITGIDLAEKIRDYDPAAKIIFIIPNDEIPPLTSQKCIEVLGFIRQDQPLVKFREKIIDLLLLAQKRIDEIRKNQNIAFVFSIGPQTFNIDFNEIVFLETSELPHRLKLTTINDEYEFYGKLSYFEKNYSLFFRISRSCLINPKQIRRINYQTRYIHFYNKSYRKFSLGNATKIKKIFKRKLN